MEHGNLGTPSGNHPNNSERMTDDHVCITGNLRTAHGDLGAPISERTPVVQWGRVCRIKQKARWSD
jgi:hypothetical protein